MQQASYKGVTELTPVEGEGTQELQEATPTPEAGGTKGGA